MNREAELLQLINKLADVVAYLGSAIDGISFPFRDQVDRRVKEVIADIEKLNGGKLDYPRKRYYE